MTPSITNLRLVILARWPGTQYELAQRCCMQTMCLNRYVMGHKKMLNHHRAILAHVLKVEPDELDGWISGEDLYQKLAS